MILVNDTTNRVTNHIISEINKLEKSKEQSESVLKIYELQVNQLKEYAKKMYGSNFTVTHVTIHALKGKIESDKKKIDLLKSCLTIQDYHKQPKLTEVAD